MNNYQQVFEKIKELCIEANDFQSDACYEEITEMLKGRVSLPVEFYLDSLFHIGMIKYEKENNNVGLTSKGISTKNLFM